MENILQSIVLKRCLTVTAVMLLLILSKKPIISPLGRWYQSTYVLRFYLCYFKKNYYYPLDLRTSEQMADKYFRNSWGYGVILMSHAWIHCFVLFWEKGKLPPNFAKNLVVPSFGTLL